MRELVRADGALSSADLPLLLRDRPDVLRQLLDLGVQQDNNGELRVTYRPLRDVGHESDCPFEAELVSRLQLSGRWQMLGHPAVELLLEVTRQDTLWLAITRLVLFVAFLATLCTKVILDLYDVEQGYSELWWVLITFTCTRILSPIVKIIFMKFRTVLTLRFWPGVITTALTFVALFLPRDDRAAHAAALLAVFFELTLVIESVPKWKATKAISSLLHVTRSIVGYLFLYLPILLGFALAFFVLLKKDVRDRKDSLFRGDVLLMTVAAMVIGEVDVAEINTQAPQSFGGFSVCTAIFLLFLVLVPLVMLNMLLALTISDTTKFLSKGSSEYLHHVASMTSTSQLAVFSLDRKLQALRNRLPGWLFSCISSLTLCVKWRSALPRQFEVEGSSCVTLVVSPVGDDGKTVHVTVWGSKRHFSVSRNVRHGLDQIVQDRVAMDTNGTETDLPPTISDGEDVLQKVAGQLQAALDMQKLMVHQLQAIRGEMVKQSEEIRKGRMEHQLQAMREEIADQTEAMRRGMMGQLEAMRKEMKSIDSI